LPLVLRLLDHQVVGPQGELLGNVDDLVLRHVGDHLQVVAFMTGPDGLARRQGGRGGRWLHAIWTRLHPLEHPRPVVVPLEEVTTVDSAVEVTSSAARLLGGSAGFELWLRQHVVGRLPGALGGDTDAGPGAAPALERGPLPESYLLQEGDHTTSELLGSTVVAGDRALGVVSELLARPLSPGALRFGRLVLTDVVCSRRRLGAELGYTMAPQGPKVLEALMRRLHRDDVRVDLRQARLSWTDRRLDVSERTSLRHPRESTGPAAG
jgi:hypothetical protein